MDINELKRLAEAFPSDLDWDSNTEPFFNGPSGESLGGGSTGFYCVYGAPFTIDDDQYDGPTYVETCKADFAKFMVAARDGVLTLIAENKRLAALLECSQGDMCQADKIMDRDRLDAERYRWLRANNYDTGSYYPNHKYNAAAWFEHLDDAAIDAAIAAEVSSNEA